LILRHIGVLLESPYAWFMVLVLRDAGLGRVPFSAGEELCQHGSEDLRVGAVALTGQSAMV
jgi:hypothetical protein